MSQENGFTIQYWQWDIQDMHTCTIFYKLIAFYHYLMSIMELDDACPPEKLKNVNNDFLEYITNCKIRLNKNKIYLIL